MPRSNYWQRENPFPGFLQNELFRFLDEYFRPETRGTGQAAPTDLEPTAWSPLIDTYETPEETLVVAEIPGVDPTKVELSLTGNLLILRGVKPPSDSLEPNLQSREAGSGRSCDRSWSPAMLTLTPSRPMRKTVC